MGMMRTIGLIGGMSWESSIEYYRIINRGMREALGGAHSAKSVMVSVDFDEIEALQMAGEWDRAANVLIDCARKVEGAGADFVLICTNTMHLLAEEIQAGIKIPLLHIADAAARQILDAGLHQVGLLGTRFTMEKDFYRGRLRKKYGLQVLIPDESDRELVHRVIYDELVQGLIRDESRAAYQEVIFRLQESGAEGVILGCTEIGSLIKEGDVPLPVFDTMGIHARAAVAAALGRFDF
jgi:aspartate racemase